MTTPEQCFVVLGADGGVLAAFTDSGAAEAYAGARPGRRLASAPLVSGSIELTTVHTRWVEYGDDGRVRAHAHETYGWCPQLDTAEGAPPEAEVEHYRDGDVQRFLGVGTDLEQVDAGLRALARPETALSPDENITR